MVLKMKHPKGDSSTPFNFLITQLVEIPFPQSVHLCMRVTSGIHRYSKGQTPMTVMPIGLYVYYIHITLHFQLKEGKKMIY